jgi:catechol 2,3-dioxygenase-like lactoylglutathione lyase family enzyme
MTAPKLKALQHIALKVRDIETSLKFYVEVLGFRVIERHAGGEIPGYEHGLNFITCTNLHHVMNLAELAPEYRPKDAPPPVNTLAKPAFGLHHFAFEVEDKAEYEAWQKHLADHGVEIVHGPMVHSPTHPEGDGSWGENRAMYFCDPDGNAVEIFCDMGIVDENGEMDREWFADRLRREGYDPAETSPAETGKYKGQPQSV